MSLTRDAHLRGELVVLGELSRWSWRLCRLLVRLMMTAGAWQEQRSFAGWRPMTTSGAISSFAPVVGRDPRLLILGSMPGEESLRQGRYYAHPRNAFWPWMLELLGLTPTSTYDERLDGLRSHHIALWDVLASCVRAGSLDSAIVRASASANPIVELLEAAPSICVIACNGKAAHALLGKHCGSQIAAVRPGVEVLCLPSTSPANASITMMAKREAWRCALVRANVLPGAS